MKLLRSIIIIFFTINSLVIAETCHEQTGWCYVQSTSQAFYMFNTVTIGGNEIIPGEWEGSPPGECPFDDCDVVAAFNGETCVAWSYYYKVNDVFTLVLMGADGLTGGAENYLNNGDYPTFKIYQAATGNYFNGVIENGIPMFTNFGYPSSEELKAEEDADGNVLSIDTINEINGFSLYEPYPNPFNPITNITYEIPFKSHITLSIYDLSGKKLEDLVNGPAQAGIYTAQWNAGQFSSGMYVVKLIASDYQKTQNIVLIK